MIHCWHQEDFLDAIQILHKAAHAMKLSDSIFDYSIGHENIERCQDVSEEPIFVGGHDAVANKAVIAAIADVEKAVNRRLRECGVRIEVSAYWMNIADSELNPDCSHGRVIVDCTRERQVS